MLVVRPSEPFLTEDVAAAAEEMVQVIFFKKAIFIRSGAKGNNNHGGLEMEPKYDFANPC